MKTLNDLCTTACTPKAETTCADQFRVKEEATSINALYAQQQDASKDHNPVFSANPIYDEWPEFQDDLENSQLHHSTVHGSE